MCFEVIRVSPINSSSTSTTTTTSSSSSSSSSSSLPLYRSAAVQSTCGCFRGGVFSTVSIMDSLVVVVVVVSSQQ
ncbi:hypothetical protein E2C01_033885 [Portunus trituberculatus]|uniref:Uncharacterized protein n=1 Tax=Portunus trituberculatus TaxID=210409 RepID=A0A5B7F4X0_PORTR|nr:hypothetical protein [Portunus trituberculatus]